MLAHFETDKGSKWIPADKPDDPFSGMVRGPVSRGTLEIRGFGLPRRTNEHDEPLAGLRLLARIADILSRAKMSLATQQLW